MSNVIDLDKKWKPDDAWRDLLLGLRAEQEKEATVIAFARKFLIPVCSREKYDLIMDVFDDKVQQSYFDKVSPSVIEKLYTDLKFLLDEIPLKRGRLQRLNEVKIMFTKRIEAVANAVRLAKQATGAERQIVVLAPTRGGKTVTANYLQKEMKARFVEVRDVWRHSHRGKEVLADICKGVGMMTWSKRIAKAQDELVAFLGDRDIVVCFDEAEYFGAAALNLLKLLLNKTRIIPVLLLVPEEYDKWFETESMKSAAYQNRGRTLALIDGTIVDPEDVALFFPEDQFAKRKDALELLATAASRFGHFSLVKRVAEQLIGVPNASMDAVKDAIKVANRQMIRGG
jgi:hypothetical protein